MTIQGNIVLDLIPSGPAFDYEPGDDDEELKVRRVITACEHCAKDIRALFTTGFLIAECEDVPLQATDIFVSDAEISKALNGMLAKRPITREYYNEHWSQLSKRLAYKTGAVMFPPVEDGDPEDTVLRFKAEVAEGVFGRIYAKQPDCTTKCKAGLQVYVEDTQAGDDGEWKDWTVCFDGDKTGLIQVVASVEFKVL